MKKKFYITTAIDYVNARPHIGHAFEKVIADALARWHKQKKEKVFFLTGTDENAQKNAIVAKEEGIEVQKFVDRNSKTFIELCEKLDIDYDRFIRTTEKEHKKIAQDIFKKVYDKGEIYKGKYEGLYCLGCESFILERELVDGKCPEHNKAPKKLSEEAYFFKLSKYKKKLIKFVENYIVPTSKKNEILSRLKNEELRDLCVSRTNLDWGIDSPIDKKFKIYVWFDALLNYYSGANGNWPAEVHVIGKGINWFHSVIWPAILMSAGIELPEKLLVHGYLNIGGKKMSKSLGNVIDPIKLIEKYGSDVVRYSLLRCSVFDDSDYSEEILIQRNNNELANKLGNLVSRVSSLISKNGVSKCENKLLKKLNEKKINKLMKNYELDKALNEIFAFIDVCNEYVQNKKPWETKDKKVLYELKECILKIADLLWAFIPSASEKITKQFSVKNIKKEKILFKKIELELTPKGVPRDISNTLYPKGHEKGITKGHKTSKISTRGKVKKDSKPEGIMTMKEVNFGDWEKLDLRVAQIKKVEDITGADKLWKLELNVGELGKRIICAGIKKHYSKKDLVGKNIIYFSNLAPRKMRGIESQGMLLAAVSKNPEKVVLISPDKNIKTGSRVS